MNEKALACGHSSGSDRCKQGRDGLPHLQHTAMQCMKYSIIIMLCASLNACATDHIPKQTFLAGKTVSGINKVALTTSVNPPEVRYSQTTDAKASVILFGLLGGKIEEAIRRNIDAKHAAKINENLHFTLYEDRIAESFMMSVREGRVFETIEYVKDKSKDNNIFLSKGFDSIINLNVDKIVLEKEGDDKVRIGVFIKALMINLHSGREVLNRDDFVSASEAKELAYYEKNGLKELDAILDKAGKKVAYDFLYLK